MPKCYTKYDERCEWRRAGGETEATRKLHEMLLTTTASGSVPAWFVRAQSATSFHACKLGT
jgi:hypothetical protein